MARKTAKRMADWLRAHVHPLSGGSTDYDALLGLIGDAHLVLLGSSTHGTAEFYAARAAITRRLVVEKGFGIVAVEADWPAAARVNEYIQGGPGEPLEALEGFRRFPAWLWRNNLLLDLVAWLRRFNDQIPQGGPKVAFYGLDLFNLPAAVSETIRHLDRAAPGLAEEVQIHVGDLVPPLADSREEALGVRLGSAACEDEVARALDDILKESYDLVRQGAGAEELQAEMAALAAMHSEQYYRRLAAGDGGLWNLRDRHMVQVLDRLLAWHGPGAKAVVWAHNSHVGDMRATREGEEGKVNLCSILREKYGDQVVAVGFGTFQGTVTAAPAWDAAPEFMSLPKAMPYSVEELFHHSGVGRFYLPLRALTPGVVPRGLLFEEVPERVFGVVENPARVRSRPYVSGRLAQRYDAYFFYGTTLAVEPLDVQAPAGLDTFPSGE